MNNLELAVAVIVIRGERLAQTNPLGQVSCTATWYVPTLSILTTLVFPVMPGSETPLYSQAKEISPPLAPPIRAVRVVDWPGNRLVRGEAARFTLGTFLTVRMASSEIVGVVQVLFDSNARYRLSFITKRAFETV